MKLLAIDPGYDKVGYSIFEKIVNKGTSFRYIASDLIKTSKTQSHELRLKTIYDVLNNIIGEHTIELMVVEQLFFFKNHKTVIKVAQSIGILELLAAQHGIDMERLTPLQIKQIVTGNGAADKKAVQKMIKLTLENEIPIKDDDQADAIACGLAYCYLTKY